MRYWYGYATVFNFQDTQSDNALRARCRRPTRAAAAVGLPRAAWRMAAPGWRYRALLVLVVALSGGMTIGMCSYAFGSYVRPPSSPSQTLNPHPGLYA